MSIVPCHLQKNNKEIILAKQDKLTMMTYYGQQKET